MAPVIEMLPSPLSPVVRRALRDLAEAYCRRAKFRASPNDPSEKVWLRATGNPQFLARMDDGRSPQLDTIDRAVAWFDDNWPEGAKWPKSIERPSRRRTLERPRRRASPVIEEAAD
jgi:hypothetical protein